MNAAYVIIAHGIKPSKLTGSLPAVVLVRELLAACRPQCLLLQKI